MHFDRPWALVLLALAIPLAWPRGQTVRAAHRALRAAVLVALVLALAGASLVLPSTRQATIFVADLSASDAAARPFMTGFIRNALAARPAGDAAGVVDVGANAAVDVPPSAAPRFAGFGAAVDDQATNLQRGLGLAEALLPPGYRPRIVVLSDGRQNAGDALAEAERLRGLGVTVDVVPAPGSGGGDVAVRDVQAPSYVRAGADVQAQVTLTSTVAQTATLHVYEDSTLVATRTLSLPAGDAVATVTLHDPPAGEHEIRATIQAPADAVPQNDAGAALVDVQGPPQVLVVDGEPGSGANLSAALSAAGMQVHTLAPQAVPPSAAELSPYDAVVLADVPAAALLPQAQQAIADYVRQEGGGLVAVGGQNSYSLGGWAGTPIEGVLPVSMEVPRRKDTPKVALVVIIESLESTARVNVGREAVKGMIGILDPQDLIAVSGATAGWAVPLGPATDPAKIDAEIDAMPTGDPPSYIPYLQQAEAVLQSSGAQIKHVVLIGDGDAQSDPSSAYQQTAQRMASEGITLSTIATGVIGPSGTALMQNLAQWGHGRYYDGNNVYQIPQLLLDESRQDTRVSVVKESFVPQVFAQSPVLSGITGLPALTGYIATTPKPTAQVVLQSPQQDPVLALWQPGLGRAAAWTSDAQGLWSAAMVGWPGFAAFWSNVVSWALRPPDTGQLEVTTAVQGAVAQVTAQLAPAALQALGATAPATLSAAVSGPGGQTGTAALSATAPGRYTGDVPVPQAGVYVLDLGTGAVHLGTADVVVPYSPEFAPSGAGGGTGAALLAQLARAGGGKALTAPRQAFAPDLPWHTARISLAPALLLLAAILWPLDVAARRLGVDPAAVRSALAAHGRRRRAAGPPTLGAAMAARVRQRRRPLGPPAPEAPPREAAAPEPARPQPKVAAGGETAVEAEGYTSRLLGARERGRQRALRRRGH